ncbi:hypothetical protein BC941DRAFT_398692 [Chlamydoabsidia padenii]|nr:hypothetical protein BC941DRAFT_398692 [Chlamydoabsidia padenii]
MSSVELEWRNYLLENKIIENRREIKKRGAALALLRSLLPSFVQLCVKENNLKQDDFDCQLIPFGSYGLGAQCVGSDIDVVLLAPMAIRRKDFIRFFTKLLKLQPLIYDVETISYANVPIIKCVIDSINIDISFITLQMMSVPADIDLLNDNFLHDLEGTCLASVNGPRVNQFILKHIYPNDMPAFTLALQCIKHWATQRYIYNKPMGYLNGGAWTLLLVKTYFLKRSQGSPNNGGNDILNDILLNQSPTSSPSSSSSSSFYPQPSLDSHSSSSTNSSTITIPTNDLLSPAQTISFISLLESFFSMWSTWPWPDPVILTKSIPVISDHPTSDSTTLDNLGDFCDSLLPLVTPCYPVTNASPFVTKSTLAVITKELQRADQILQYDGFAQLTQKMDKLFKPLNIIKEYKHFIKVTVSCDTGKSHDIWSRRMKSYLPRLVQLLQSLDEIKIARPFTKSYASFVSYRTLYDKDTLRHGEVLTETSSIGPLEPGSLFINCFLIGLEFNDYCKLEDTLVDMVGVKQAFSDEIDSRMNARDSDVYVHLDAINRRQVASLIQNAIE